MNKVALVIIYNHQYNKNIEVLEQIYKDRFSNIYHLVPFYNGEKSNVIPVYDNSYYFQGYVAQGFKSFFKEDYDHYFFIADDLVLNPIINEKNYTEHLRLKQNTCFLPGFITLHDRKDWWSGVGYAFRYNINVPGVEAKAYLPDYDIALQAFKNYGLEIKPLSFNQIWKTPVSIKDLVKMIIKVLSFNQIGKTPVSIKDLRRMIIEDIFYIIRKIKSKLSKKQYNLSYPIVGGYCDIFVVSSDAIKQFCYYCGVFATTKLFVEVGLPTSLVLSAEEIVTEMDLKLQGKALWTKEDYIILDKYERKLENLLDDFPKNHLYIHPVKLSKWNTKSRKKS